MHKHRKTKIEMNKYKFKFSEGKTVYEHRFLMEEKLGRKLKHNEAVHHIDRNKSNNSLINLVVMDISEHASIHAIENKLGKDRIGVSPTNKISESVINEILCDRKNRMKLKDIAVKYNISYPTIQKICQDIKIRVHNFSDERRLNISNFMLNNKHAKK